MKNENGIEKSAILKGQTLVNMLKFKETFTALYNIGSYVYSDNKITIVGNGVGEGFAKSDIAVNLESNKTYTFKGNCDKGFNIDNGFIYLLLNNSSSKATRINTGNTTFQVSESGVYYVRLDIRDSSQTYVFSDLMILEGDYTNQDIPYFEGMKSVQMPVLKTVGKNLLEYIEWEIDKRLVTNGDVGEYIGNNVSNYINVSNLDVITFSGFSKSSHCLYDKDKNIIGERVLSSNMTIDVSGVDYIRVTINNTIDYSNPQMEAGTVATSYEPYKTNILTVNEEVELRGIGEVKDELNLLTGELIQRVNEIVLDGSNNQFIEALKEAKGDYLKFGLLLELPAPFTHNIPLLSNNMKTETYVTSKEGRQEQIYIHNHTATNTELRVCILPSKLQTPDANGFNLYLSENPITVQYPLASESVKTVVLNIKDQDNQPQERMKLFPNGHINTSSSTFPPILELKGITHNNKLNMTTTNGTNNTQLATLDNLVLDGIICRDGTIVRDSYDVESGLYTKRVFRFTVDDKFARTLAKDGIGTNFIQFSILNAVPKADSKRYGVANNILFSTIGDRRISINESGSIFINLLKEELISYDVDGLLDWIKRNGDIEVAYQMATPQIIHMQPNMTPYVSTRPYQGSIESQGNILESSYLDYTSEQSIVSPKPLGDGDVLRWEQGSQCYVYENDKEYIPLTDYNQRIGTVLDLEEEDGEQYVENLDGGDIVVDVPFKEKAVYERHLTPYEDKVIYPTQDKLDPTGKIEVDYICGSTWQNPNDLSDIRHVGTLREDGQYDVTIRRSGDDEIRLMDGTTHLSLDGDGLNPSEFELTFFNNGGVEVGKYGDTSHTLEDCVLDSKLETGTVYGNTLVNVLDINASGISNTSRELTGFSFNSAQSDIEQKILTRGNYKKDTDYTLIFNSDYAFRLQIGYDMTKAEGWGNYNIKIGRNIIKVTTLSDTDCDYIMIRTSALQINYKKVTFSDFIVLEGDYTSYPTPIPYFEGVGSTIVNGFTTAKKNMLDASKFRKGGINWDNGLLENDNLAVDRSVYNGYINVKSNTTYTLSQYGANSKSYFTILEFDGSLKLIKTYDQPGISKTFTTQSTTKFIRIMFQYPLEQFKTYQCQLEESSTSTEFEPYKGITYNLPTPITLNKVGDVADTFDVVSGVETRNIEKVVLDGTWNWTSYGDKFTTTPNHVFMELLSGQISHPTNREFALLSPTTMNYNADIWNKPEYVHDNKITISMALGYDYKCQLYIPKSFLGETISFASVKQYLNDNPIEVWYERKTPQTIQHSYIPSSIQTTQEPTFILPQPLRSVPNGICDRLYWDENKGHYCIEKRIYDYTITGADGVGLMDSGTSLMVYAYGGTSITDGMLNLKDADTRYIPSYSYNNKVGNKITDTITRGSTVEAISPYNGRMYYRLLISRVGATTDSIKAWFNENPTTVYIPLATSEIIDLPHLNKKLTLPTQPNTLPIGYKVECQKANPQLGLTIPYKQLNYPSRPQNIDFKMDIADYVLTWDDVKEARQYNVILNDRVIATVKEPQWNSGEEMYGYIMVEAQNELAENLSEELYIKTVPNAPAQLTVGHNPMTDYYDFEISFIKTSAIAEYYTVQYRIDNGEWVYKTIQSDEIDPNTKVLWSFSVYEINEQIEVWATATNEIGTNDILPTAIYYMSPTPQWTYRINSKELFVRWMDDSPYDTQYKLRYQYKSDGIYRYAYFEGDKQEIGKLYEALIPLADDEEVSIALCVISEKENLYTKPIRASKELDPNIKPPKNFNYHWLARGLIEFYWEDNYDVDVEYEAIVEHRLTSGNNEWITDTRIFSATDTEGTGTVYRLSYQMEDLEEIRVKVRMKWAMNETEWSESLTTVFIPVEGNPPQWIRRTQTQEGLLVEWEAQEYVDSYHVYVMSNGEELQHLETMDNFIYVDLDYSNPIDIEIYEATRFSGGIQSDPSDKMQFRPTMDKHQLIHDVVTPDTLTYEIEVDTVQKGIKERQVIHDINTTPKVTDKQPMDVAIKSPFTLSFHPLQLDVHQAGSKYYGDTELHIKTLDVKSRDAIEVLSFERITDQYGVDFTVYTPSASKYPITLEVNRVRIVCFGDSLTSGHPGFWAETGTGDPQHCYEYWLDRRLKGQYEIINKGYGSDTTDRMLARFDRDVLANNPQYCIIQGGTNDLYWAMAESMGDQEALDMKLDVMKANIMEMVKRCWDNNIVPIVGNLIPRTGATGIYKTALYDFNAWIISWCTEQAAEGRNIFYVDLFNAGKEAVPPTPIEDPTNPGAMNPIYDGDALFDEFGNIVKQGRGIHLNKEGYRIWAEAIPLSIFKTYDSGLRMYKDLHCTDEDNYDDSDKQNPFYTISIDNVRRSKTKTVVRYIKNIGKTQVLFAMYASDEYNMSIEFVGSDGEKGAYANGLLAPNMIAKVTMEINLDNKDSKASFNLHLAAREYNQN